MTLNRKKRLPWIYFHLLAAIRHRKLFALFVLLLSILTSALMVWNIKAVEYITSLLVSKSMIDSLKQVTPNDVQSIISVLGLGDYPNSEAVIQAFLDRANNTAEFYDLIIKQFFYDFVSYSTNGVYIEFLGLHLGLYSFAFSMIIDIGLIILLAYAREILAGNVALAYENKLRRQLISKLIDQDVEFFDSHHAGQIISTVVKDSTIVNNYIKEAPSIYLLAIINVLFSSILMLTISWQLSLCVFGILILFVIVIFISVWISSKATRNINEIAEQQNNDISEKIYSIKLVKSFGTFTQEKAHFDEMINQTTKREKKKFFVSEIPSALIIGGVGSFSMASIVFGVFLFYNQTQSLISVITAFTCGVIVMTIPIMQLRQIISIIPKSRIAANNISELLMNEIKIDKFKSQLIEEPVRLIQFKNVDFQYPHTNKNIFSNFSLELRSGHSYAFVGETGSGKSTIAKLLLRFYDYQNGEIIINDKFNLREVNLKVWLDKIGYVDQEPQILSGTIYDNIKYGLTDKTNEDVIAACQKAKLHDLIMKWPMQYDTVLAERGAQLSGGQKQRLVIARLILKNPEILILDEATSALDNIVEAEIQKELELLMKGRTTIAIAHRLSTIKNFDQIFVLSQEEGVIQQGTFDELVAIDGIFQNLYRLSK